MEDLDKFLTFVFNHIDDDRIDFTKKIKYGHRHYYIYINLELPDDPTGGYVRDNKQLSILVDNRNLCIEVGIWEDLIVFENLELVRKWSEILEEHYNSKLSTSLKQRVDSFLRNTCSKDKDLWREWTVDRLFEDDGLAKNNPDTE